MIFDLVVHNAHVYDGTGAEPFVGDVGVTGDRIKAIGTLDRSAARRVIDADGRAVAPGFIDVHSHDDFAVLVEPHVVFKVVQGITTEIVGNCGFGAAPFAEAQQSFAGWHPVVSEMSPWDGYAGYLAAVDDARPSLNVATLVAHGMLRRAVVGTNDRRARRTELDQMRGHAGADMEAGALGVSSGLAYTPGRYADTAELSFIAEEAARFGGLYVSHIRNEADHLLDAVSEAIAIGKRSGARPHISHLKASGERNWGQTRAALSLIDEARAAGVPATADRYPYTWGSTLLKEIVDNDALGGGQGPFGYVSPDDVRLCSVPGAPEWEGVSLAALSQLLDVDVAAAVGAVLERAESAVVATRTMAESDVREVLAHPATMIGSDGIPAGSKPHPRLWGTVPRFLGRYCRDEGLLSMPEAIHRLTGLAAATFGLADRGLVAEDAFADIVMLDLESVIDTATFDFPASAPKGIPFVIVNGMVVVEDGSHTGARPGRALRRG